MQVKIKINYSEDDLYCTYSKERIQIGEKYGIVLEDYFDEVIEKPYKLEYIPEESDDEDDYLDYPRT